MWCTTRPHGRLISAIDGLTQNGESSPCSIAEHACCCARTHGALTCIARLSPGLSGLVHHTPTALKTLPLQQAQRATAAAVAGHVPNKVERAPQRQRRHRTARGAAEQKRSAAESSLRAEKRPHRQPPNHCGHERDYMHPGQPSASTAVDAEERGLRTAACQACGLRLARPQPSSAGSKRASRPRARQMPVLHTWIRRPSCGRLQGALLPSKIAGDHYRCMPATTKALTAQTSALSAAWPPCGRAPFTQSPWPGWP